MNRKHEEGKWIKHLVCSMCGCDWIDGKCADCIYFNARKQARELALKDEMTSEVSRQIEQNKIASFAWGTNTYQGD